MSGARRGVRVRRWGGDAVHPLQGWRATTQSAGQDAGGFDSGRADRRWGCGERGGGSCGGRDGRGLGTWLGASEYACAWSGRRMESSGAQVEGAVGGSGKKHWQIVRQDSEQDSRKKSNLTHQGRPHPMSVDGKIDLQIYSREVGACLMDMHKNTELDAITTEDNDSDAPLRRRPAQRLQNVEEKGPTCFGPEKVRRSRAELQLSFHADHHSILAKARYSGTCGLRELHRRPATRTLLVVGQMFPGASESSAERHRTGGKFAHVGTYFLRTRRAEEVGSDHLYLASDLLRLEREQLQKSISEETMPVQWIVNLSHSKVIASQNQRRGAGVNTGCAKITANLRPTAQARDPLSFSSGSERFNWKLEMHDLKCPQLSTEHLNKSKVGICCGRLPLKFVSSFTAQLFIEVVSRTIERGLARACGICPELQVE
ncbi:hypothetical protein FB451DRAFT_1373728 [Mycena latifolia]|nr:hypothetical protein FB451DRAFT_1373728 [Mycena latifolia]